MATYAIVNSDNIVIKAVKVSNNITTVDGQEDSQLGVQFLQQIYGIDNTYVQYSSAAPEHLQACIGDTYIAETNTFKSVQPFPSWTFNESLKKWEPPTPCPVAEGEYCLWSETNSRWYDGPQLNEYITAFDGTEREAQESLGAAPAQNPIPL